LSLLFLGVGKSFLIKQILADRLELFPQKFDKIYFCCSGYNEFATIEPYYDELKNLCPDIVLQSTLISGADLYSDLHLKHNILIILDDMEREATADVFVADLYTKLSNHQGLSIITTMQCGFSGNRKYFHSIMRSCNTLILFDSRIDKTLICNMSKKLFPYRKSFLEEVFRKIASFANFPPYIVIDCNSFNSFTQRFAVKTAIFPRKVGKSRILFAPIIFKTPEIYKK
jgi:hypothetical protein